MTPSGAVLTTSAGCSPDSARRNRAVAPWIGEHRESRPPDAAGAATELQLEAGEPRLIRLVEGNTCSGLPSYMTIVILTRGVLSQSAAGH